MVRHGRVATVVAALAAVLCGVGLTVPAYAGEGGIVHTDYTTDDDPVLRNPERGLFATMDSLALIADGGPDVLRRAHDTGTVVHVYVDLSPFYQSDSPDNAVETRIPDGELARYDTAFGLLRDAGLKVILRFSYTPHGTTVCGGGVGEDDDQAPDDDPTRPSTLPDASLATILEHIEQVSDVLWRNADVIASFEAGFLGEFGEWHCSVNAIDHIPRNGNDIDPAVQQAVIAAERAHFPPRTIEMRYPTDIQALFPTPESRAGIGSHQDCYASTRDDANTWRGSASDVETQMGLISTLGETSAVSATVCASYPERVNCDVALVDDGYVFDELPIAEMPFMHFSLFAADEGDQSTWLDPYRASSPGWPDGCWNRIQGSLGYRLSLSSSDLPATAAAGESMHVTVALQNTGFAAMYNPRPVYLVLDHHGRSVSLPLGIDARAWAPGVWLIDQDVQLPADLARGDYTVSLWLPDASPALADDPAFAVHLANTGTWEAGTGANRLGCLTVGRERGCGGARLAESGMSAPLTWLPGVLLLAAGVAVTMTARRRSHRGG